MRTYSSFCGTVCSDSTGTVTSDAAVRLHRRYQVNNNFSVLCFFHATPPSKSATISSIASRSFC